LKGKTKKHMELWDVLDVNRRKTGRKHERGMPMQEGDFHLVVYIWIISSEGKILLTQRTPNKDFPLCWETTGGSALAGDTSLGAAMREVYEETGFKLDPEKGRIVESNIRPPVIYDIWMFEQDFDISNVVLQEGETCDAKWAAVDEILEYAANGNFVPLFYETEEIFKIANDILKKAK